MEPKVPAGDISYTERVDKLLKKLREQVEEQQDVLQKLRASVTPIDPEPSYDPISHLQQLRTLKKAYELATSEMLQLPSKSSLVPTLLALRGTDTCIKESQACIADTEIDFKKLQKRLEKEQADLSDAKLIHSGLESRISELQGEIEVRSQKSPEQIAKDMIRDLKKKKQHYDIETGKLVEAFNGFINEYLAPMLAAEELGGPIVGDVLDIDEEMLGAGFSAQGKVKRSKKGVNESKRQKKIDEIWGRRPEADEPRDEKQEAAAEMRELTEQLLNSAVEAEDAGPGAYVDLDRESAAARFLVRSKVAQFHPRDARKLRLVDFGGELED